MLKLYVKAKDMLANLHRREEAQDAFEYPLIIGAVSVTVILALAAIGADGGLFDTVLDNVTTAVNRLFPLA